jgi:2-keto-3-deoxy-L-rhamnonate aldolase RhmA
MANNYEYEIQGNYGYGWERLTTEDNPFNAKAMLDCYNTNEPQYAHRMVRIRKAIEVIA